MHPVNQSPPSGGGVSAAFLPSSSVPQLLASACTRGSPPATSVEQDRAEALRVKRERQRVASRKYRQRKREQLQAVAASQNVSLLVSSSLAASPFPPQCADPSTHFHGAPANAGLDSGPPFAGVAGSEFARGQCSFFSAGPHAVEGGDSVRRGLTFASLGAPQMPPPPVQMSPQFLPAQAATGAEAECSGVNAHHASLPQDPADPASSALGPSPRPAKKWRTSQSPGLVAAGPLVSPPPCSAPSALSSPVSASAHLPFSPLASYGSNAFAPNACPPTALVGESPTPSDLPKKAGGPPGTGPPPVPVFQNGALLTSLYPAPSSPAVLINGSPSVSSPGLGPATALRLSEQDASPQADTTSSLGGSSDLATSSLAAPGLGGSLHGGRALPSPSSVVLTGAGGSRPEVEASFSSVSAPPCLSQISAASGMVLGDLPGAGRGGGFAAPEAARKRGGLDSEGPGLGVGGIPQGPALAVGYPRAADGHRGLELASEEARRESESAEELGRTVLQRPGSGATGGCYVFPASVGLHAVANAAQGCGPLDLAAVTSSHMDPVHHFPFHVSHAMQMSHPHLQASTEAVNLSEGSALRPSDSGAGPRPDEPPRGFPSLLESPPCPYPRDSEEGSSLVSTSDSSGLGRDSEGPTFSAGPSLNVALREGSVDEQLRGSLPSASSRAGSNQGSVGRPRLSPCFSAPLAAGLQSANLQTASVSSLPSDAGAGSGSRPRLEPGASLHPVSHVAPPLAPSGLRASPSDAAGSHAVPPTYMAMSEGRHSVPASPPSFPGFSGGRVGPPAPRGVSPSAPTASLCLGAQAACLVAGAGLGGGASGAGVGAGRRLNERGAVWGSRQLVLKLREVHRSAAHLTMQTMKEMAALCEEVVRKGEREKWARPIRGGAEREARRLRQGLLREAQLLVRERDETTSDRQDNAEEL
ncbi:hypothetical protein TGMAS_200410 [Toxoplasma gondii MAS]|uniref:BZIP domain-containing protein n=5 Tax=Toxoplasma gondii TaxID=5811 RepID=B9QR52_TOXGV|nr:hypothetical protein TGVEG_200410 [Toxoplasma gondii VEG]KFG27941.1 hypothetical protein TGP89_200410 [Toxoplasma gondii p89]KFH01548.1 hypothetical protein TGMAS_200410 [Toxoplasma gondii MAS]PUA83502.1 hypothetical protein TGBR9_200410 [Toxoplasma gondii TgCATBr9]CEL75535.1 TPA: hypothetical protein BN1205_058560 [Toxoplasma gondii VEG]